MVLDFFFSLWTATTGAYYKWINRFLCINATDFSVCLSLSGTGVSACFQFSWLLLQLFKSPFYYFERPFDFLNFYFSSWLPLVCGSGFDSLILFLDVFAFPLMKKVYGKISQSLWRNRQKCPWKAVQRDKSHFSDMPVILFRGWLMHMCSSCESETKGKILWRCRFFIEWFSLSWFVEHWLHIYIFSESRS